MNAHTGNTIAAAKHTLARCWPGRHNPKPWVLLQQGRWERARFQGWNSREDVGYSGFGTSGFGVAGPSTGMRVLAYDP